MTDIQKVTDDIFQKEVLNNNLPVIVEFTAVWCGPCKMLEPIIKQLAIDWEGKVKIVKVDVDENPQITMTNQVMGVPTLILFVNGKPTERVSGYQPKDRLIKKFSPYIK